MAELIRATRLIASGEPVAIETAERVSASGPDPGRHATLSGMKVNRVIGRHLPF